MADGSPRSGDPVVDSVPVPAAGPAGGPVTDRPWMYGRQGLEPVTLPWSWAEHHLAQARSYWICSTRPDGRPHARPVWGVWREGACHFSTGSAAGRHLRTGSDLTVHLGPGGQVVILECVVEVLPATQVPAELIADYAGKYNWPMDPVATEPWYLARPRVAFGWLVDESGLDGGAAFHGTATRWRFATD